jgi:hypothetical protein
MMTMMGTYKSDYTIKSEEIMSPVDNPNQVHMLADIAKSKVLGNVPMITVSYLFTSLMH